jgi:NADP-dependent aldehyde dehydrogenase
MIASVDPRTGIVVEEIGEPTGDLDEVCARAEPALTDLVDLGRAGRAAMLRAMAAALEVRRAQIVAVADRETGLGPQRLGTELTRTTFQLELFAQVLEEGAYLEATIDHAGTTPAGPRPDLRRLLTPLGPVAVFGASNFPLAFSVPGGDTASALAAGCPVVVLGHDAHPATSVLAAEALLEGARAAGLHSSVVGLTFGHANALRLVGHPAMRAIGFTGSVRVGRMLADLAAARPDPIPFYGELGAMNTVVVCPAAASDRGAQIGAGLAASMLLGVGQFCTKPGVAILPAGTAGAAIREAVLERIESAPAGTMLSDRIATAYAFGTSRLVQTPGVEVLARGGGTPDGGSWGTPLVLGADPDALHGDLVEECFGPVLLLVEYSSDEEALAILRRFGPGLTATVHADAADRTFARRLLDLATRTVGRVVWNGFPTGVAVTWAMHHGGPYPATTNALHTSVGATAIRRWLRPVCYQDVPEDLLPDELRDVPTAALTRRVDGRLRLES